MSRPRPNSAQKFPTSAVSRRSVEKTALRRTAHRVLRRFESHTVPLGQSILLRRDQSRRLNEFQRSHVEYPPLQPTDFRTVYCRVIDHDGHPLRRSCGKPLMTRLFFEVAAYEYTRRPRWAMRARSVWYFLAWDVLGLAVQRTRCSSRKAALALFNVPAERLAVPQASDGNGLVALSEKPSRPRARRQGDTHAL